MDLDLQEHQAADREELSLVVDFLGTIGYFICAQVVPLSQLFHGVSAMFTSKELDDFDESAIRLRIAAAAIHRAVAALDDPNHPEFNREQVHADIRRAVCNLNDAVAWLGGYERPLSLQCTMTDGVANFEWK